MLRSVGILMQMLRSADSVECPEPEAFSPAVNSVPRTLSRLPMRLYAQRTQPLFHQSPVFGKFICQLVITGRFTY